jgi:jouberin
MYHPIVRVHIIDLDMEGQYVKNLNRQNVLLYYEKENIKRDYIPPIMTTPYDFKVNRSIIPKWEEIIVFNEDFNYFIQDKPNCLLLFEIIDSAKSADSYKNLNMQYTSQDASNSWQRIAWAFLKLVGSDKTPNVEKKIRLQLYYTQTQYKVKMTDSIVPEVYHLYKMGPRIKYPSSLHITVKSILPPHSFQPGIRSMYLLQENNKLIENFDENLNNENNELLNVKENISPAINGSKVSLTDYNTKMNQTKMIQQDAAMWSRVANLPCRVPNELSLKLNSSKLGCYSVKFSTLGSYLACACVDDNNISPLFIYEIPSGKLVMKFQGHFGLIYEIGWSKLDKYIVTASNDATSRIIDIENRSKDAYRILPHPSFLYTAKFHPNSLDIVCTSGYDKVIRVWSINDNKKVNQKYGFLLQEIYGHSGYVNSTCFSNDGLIFYSADSIGKILAWNCNSTNSSKESFKDWSLKEEIEINDLKVVEIKKN